MRDEWREQVHNRLGELPLKDVVRFAWLCAVRALPFLGAKGHFDYWIDEHKEDDRQTHLLSVLRVIDVALINTTRANAAASADAAANAAAAANANDANAANAANDTYDAYATTYAVSVAIAAAYATCTAAFSAIDTRDSGTKTRDSAVKAFDSFGDAAFGDDYHSIALADLDAITNNEYKFYSDTALYGEVWGNFQQALRDIDCGYWADWYAALFAKGFALDDDDINEIEMRFNAPQGFIQQGADAVARYVWGIKEHGAERLNETRVLILGDKGAGKTSLSLRLENPEAEMPKTEASTEGVDVLNWSISALPDKPDSAVNVHIWDFAGHVITHAAHRCFMSERCLYILLIDGRTEGGGNTEYWLEQIRNYGGEQVPILVLVNIRDSHPVNLRENTLKNTFPSIVGFYHVDIDKGGEKLEAFRQLVMEHLRENPLCGKQQISKPMFMVKEMLRKKFEQGNEYIHRDVFDSIADESSIAQDEREGLLRNLHALGLCLWYDNDEMREYKTMVLNPSWISHGIYRLINWGEQQGKRTISAEDLPHAFAKDDGNMDEWHRYEGKAAFLFKLMYEYQLAFFKDSNKIFVPLLLPADRPAENIPIFQGSEHLHIEYVANQALPPYTVSRVAVSHAPELDEDYSWRHGAILRWEGAEALVEEDERGRSVRVYVKGGNQTAYISRLRDTLDRIFDDYKSERPELAYFIHDPNSLTGDGKEKVLEKSLVDAVKQGIQTTAIGNTVHDPEALLEKYGAPQINNIFILGDNNIVQTDQSRKNTTTINIEFQQCSVNLQEALSDVIRMLKKSDIVELAEHLEECKSDLNQIEPLIKQNIAPNSPEAAEVEITLRKEGRLNGLRELYNQLCDKDSVLNKRVSELKNGKETIENLSALVGGLAKWIPYIGQALQSIGS